MTDVNDNKPVFKNAPYSYNINEEGADRTEVGRFLAEDLDSGVNAELTYSIVSGHMFGRKTM